MVRPNLYIGSKVIIWKHKCEWDDDVVQFMVPQLAILHERSQDTMSADGYGENYGALYLKPDGTASHFQWWAEGEECVVVNNDLAANQDFIYANRGLLELSEGGDDPEDEEEDEPDEDEEAISGKLLRSFVYNVDRAEMVKVAKRFNVEHNGVKHRELGIALIVRLPLNAIEALIDGEDLPDDIL